ncbi:S41 family peptidase [Algoriphagus sp. NG3]|uniref:S41 family peptidase n=1 Tax=Algoriphagus sp. NG3 TaxID=3097546 RepID=UPI002A80A80C|nr:S41 family peptidase [Algoriphagus sp. NG3]WPR76378.1 S41 family peptidase [Algoriphagus sp. NG3]
MKKIFVLLFLMSSLNCFAQQVEKFNLGFEHHKEGNTLSDGWVKWGDYIFSIDSMAFSGMKSGKIASTDAENPFGYIAYRIPAHYSGDTIKLEGYMKVKDVENGFAGLMLRIDGNGNTLALDNMQNQQVMGTKDWQKYSVSLAYPEDAEYMYVAGILVGKGEAWFDGFEVTIDGNDIQTLELPRAITDHEFDNGSLIEFGELTSDQIESLDLLGRVWGFLKYHHPQIAKGNYNWDYELFRFLPKYLEVNSANEKTRLLVDWIDTLGNLDECATCGDSVKNKFISPDFKWIEKQPEDLKNALLAVYASRGQEGNFFVKINSNNGRPDFKNENAYSAMAYPDQGFRLLSLFRYWNMINYFFPSKYLMDKEWDHALEEFIPVFLNAENELEYELAALEMIEYIQDSHAFLGGAADKIYQWKGQKFPPVKVDFVGSKLVVSGYYHAGFKEKTGLQLGDMITEVNGESIEQLIKNRSSYYPASNLPVKYKSMSMDLLRSNSSEISITYLTKDLKEQTETIELYAYENLDMYPERNLETFKVLKDSIGYFTVENIKEEDISQFKNYLKETRGLIIDLRKYPALNVASKLGSYFVSSSTPFVKFSIGMVENPGVFYLTDDITLSGESGAYKGKVIVLVNEMTQSRGEYLALALRAGENTTILGSTTAGADGEVSAILLPGGLMTQISGVGIYYPDGGETQRIGIVPDIVVTPTIEGISEQRDELLEKAIELLAKD